MKLGFIGYGNMASAILNCILEKKALSKDEVCIFDPSKDAIKKAEELGVRVAESITQLCVISDMLLLGVKPNLIKTVLNEAGNKLADKAVLSIAAGIPVDKLREYGQGRMLRIMPNTPAMVGAGAMALCTDTDLTEEEKAFAEKLMNTVGIVIWVDEKYMNVITGLSGSGPAYVAMFIEALADGGVKNGLSRDNALMLAAQTVYGTAKMVIDKKIHPAQLKDMVCSPGGTTIDGVSVLEKNAFRSSAIEAVTIATKKAGELS